MAVTRLADVIVPSAFTDYLVQNTMQKTALYESGAVVSNAVIETQLRAGADMFTVPSWMDLTGDPDAVNDDPEDFSVPNKLTSIRQRVRKSFLHGSWGAMSFASELAGSDPLVMVQNRTTAWWRRQMQGRIVATLQGIMTGNIANNGGDMVKDNSALAGDLSKFSDAAFVDAAATLGDNMSSISAVLMHSRIYAQALKLGDITFMPTTNLQVLVPVYRGCAVIVDDGMPVNNGTYVTALVGRGVIGFGMAPPVVAEGTEVENVPSAGNGGGMQVLHSRLNVGVHINGFDWIEGTLTETSPLVADLRNPVHWARVVERKAVPIAFLLTK